MYCILRIVLRYYVKFHYIIFHFVLKYKCIIAWYCIESDPVLLPCRIVLYYFMFYDIVLLRNIALHCIALIILHCIIS